MPSSDIHNNPHCSIPCYDTFVTKALVDETTNNTITAEAYTALIQQKPNNQTHFRAFEGLFDVAIIFLRKLFHPYTHTTLLTSYLKEGRLSKASLRWFSKDAFLKTRSELVSENSQETAKKIDNFVQKTIFLEKNPETQKALIPQNISPGGLGLCFLEYFL